MRSPLAAVPERRGYGKAILSAPYPLRRVGLKDIEAPPRITNIKDAPTMTFNAEQVERELHVVGVTCHRGTVEKISAALSAVPADKQVILLNWPDNTPPIPPHAVLLPVEPSLPKTALLRATPDVVGIVEDL